jgi:N-glycosylase/DNA lyase
MRKTIKLWAAGVDTQLALPCETDLLLPGLPWGRHDALDTPAYWLVMAAYAEMTATYQNHRIGNTLQEEFAACLLGGYGMPAEMGNAAFLHLRDCGCFEKTMTQAELHTALCQPLRVGNKTARYRYPAQKSIYLYEGIQKLRASPSIESRMSPVEFRDWLCTFRGVGPKTASWVTRNHFGSDEVAILDLHICRVGRNIGIFNEHESVAKHYSVMEAKFLSFSRALGVRASLLDALMWDEMRHEARRKSGVGKRQTGAPA